MKKTLISSALGVGGTGAGLTGCYALGMFDGSVNVNPSSINFSGEPKEWGLHEHDDILNFKSKNAPDCVKSIFPGFTSIVKAPGYNESGVTEKDADFTFDNAEESHGCVSIYWSREGDKNNKYTGEVTFIWSFRQEGKGFMSYFNLEFEDYGNDKAKAEVLIYALSEEGDSSKKWTITSKYELSAPNKIEISKEKLPKPGTALKELEAKNKNFWGMEMDDENISHLVKKSELGGGTHKGYVGGSYWKWTGKKGNGNINDWSSNLRGWWEEAFKSSINKDLPGKLTNITGSWEKVAMQPGTEIPKIEEW